MGDYYGIVRLALNIDSTIFVTEENGNVINSAIKNERELKKKAAQLAVLL